jgi:hypothetical protein
MISLFPHQPKCIITNQKRRNARTDYVDSQVLLLVKDHEKDEPSIKDLCLFAAKEMHGNWTEDKIRNSLNRLEKRGKVASKHLIKEGRLCRVPYPL